MFRLAPLPRKLDAALADVRNPKIDVRLSAIVDLERLARGDAREEAIRALVRVLVADRAPGLRAEAALALADAEAREALSDLIAALGDEAPRVREMVLLALGELGMLAEPKLAELIGRRLTDDEPAVRFQALNALARLGARELPDAVLAASRDVDLEVRLLALRLASSLDGAERETLSRRARALLSAADLRERTLAAILLGEEGGEQARRVLADALNTRRFCGTEEEEALVVERAGEVGLLEAAPGLRRRAFGWFGFSNAPTAFQARAALARLGEPRARRAILADLDARSRDVRSLAALSAGLAGLVEARGALERLAADPGRADPDTVSAALARLDAASQSEGAHHLSGGAGSAKRRP